MDFPPIFYIFLISYIVKNEKFSQKIPSYPLEPPFFALFLLIFYKKGHFIFNSIILFSLDKMKRKWYNQSTFDTDVLRTKNQKIFKKGDLRS